MDLENQLATIFFFHHFLAVFQEKIPIMTRIIPIRRVVVFSYIKSVKIERSIINKPDNTKKPGTLNFFITKIVTITARTIRTNEKRSIDKPIS